MAETPADSPRRMGWIVAAAVGTLIAVAIAIGGLVAFSVAVDTGTSRWRVFTGAGAGVLFWTWIVAGCWRRAHEPEPGPYDPAPVPRSAAFVAANVALAILFTALVVGGLWAGARLAKEAERIDLVRHRVMVAARAADLTVDDVRELEAQPRRWVAARAVLPVEGAEVVDLSVEGDTAAVLFRPDEGPPCVVLDLDEDGLMSTRSTSNCH